LAAAGFGGGAQLPGRARQAIGTGEGHHHLGFAVADHRVPGRAGVALRVGGGVGVEIEGERAPVVAVAGSGLHGGVGQQWGDHVDPRAAGSGSGRSALTRRPVWITRSLSAFDSVRSGRPSISSRSAAESPGDSPRGCCRCGWPRPRCARTRPSAERILTASRATDRLTSRAWASWASVGRRSPGCRFRSAMYSRIRSAVTS